MSEQASERAWRTSLQYSFVCMYRLDEFSTIYLSIQSSIHPSTFHPRPNEKERVNYSVSSNSPVRWFRSKTSTIFNQHRTFSFAHALSANLQAVLIWRLWVYISIYWRNPIQIIDGKDRHIVYEIVTNSIVICCFLPN